MPINISVTVTNVSGKEVYWTAEWPNTEYRAFDILVRKDGRKVGTTFFYRKITSTQRPDDPVGVWAGEAIVSPVVPGKSFTFKQIDLTRLYEITDPGVYTLDVSRYDENTKTSVFSDTLTLTIAP